MRDQNLSVAMLPRPDPDCRDADSRADLPRDVGENNFEHHGKRACLFHRTGVCQQCFDFRLRAPLDSIAALLAHRAPRRHEPGRPGEIRTLRLELKLLADVGLIGLPNAGKSTFISAVSAARPKIADYPFTTLTPQLGVVAHGDRRPFVLADIPGLIEGAHRGAGLGHRFLRHVERCRLLLHLVDPTAPGRDPVADIETIDRELSRYRAELAAKPQILVLTKLDALQDDAPAQRVREHAARSGVPCFAVSAVTGRGLPALLDAVADTLERLPSP